MFNHNNMESIIEQVIRGIERNNKASNRGDTKINNLIMDLL